MSNPKGVTIKLTEKQRHQIRSVTGQDHSEIRLERQAFDVNSNALPGIAAGKRVFGGKAGGKLAIKAGGKRVFGGKTGGKLAARAGGKLAARAGGKLSARVGGKLAARAGGKLSARVGGKRLGGRIGAKRIR